MEVSNNESITSIPDGVNVEDGEPSGTGGGGGGNGTSAFAKWPTPEEILTKLASSVKAKEIFTSHEWKKLSPFLTVWHPIFLVSCVCAVLIDPLFSYLFLIDDDTKCVKLDRNLRKVYIILRSVTDGFYVIELVSEASMLLFVYRRRKNYKLARSLFVGILLFMCLPIPQVLLKILELQSQYAPPAVILSSVLGLQSPQYALRVVVIYRQVMLRRNYTAGILGWINAMLLSFPFIIAAHAFGSVWYSLAIIRLRECWVNACIMTDGCNTKTYATFCSDYNQDRHINIKVLNEIRELCPINPANETKFDFGIFLSALQSNMTSSDDLPPKVSQSFWWGLRNLSSLGSNLTSVYRDEIIFSIYICVIGAVLFLVYIKAMAEWSKARFRELRLRKKMRKMDPDIDVWLYKHSIPKDRKTIITETLRRTLETNNKVDLNINTLSILPLTVRRDIMTTLRLASLNNVPEFRQLDERVLKAICEHLKPVIYTEDSYIVREGEPIQKMLFITQGRAWSYSSNNIDNNIGTIKCLEKGDFCGEELLNSGFNKFTSSFSAPISTRTIKAQSEAVEGFAVRADDLKRAIPIRWWFLWFQNTQSQSDNATRELDRWKILAASILS